jgi:hypothetical protein
LVQPASILLYDLDGTLDNIGALLLLQHVHAFGCIQQRTGDPDAARGAGHPQVHDARKPGPGERNSRQQEHPDLSHAIQFHLRCNDVTDNPASPVWAKIGGQYR